MKLPCAVVRDLLPLYAEKMVEPETRALIDGHLGECEECQRRLAGIEAGDVAPVEEAAGPLKALKREIRKRRWFAALIAALCVFIAGYTVNYRQNSLKLLPWEDGLIEVKGVESRPYEDVYGVRPEGQEAEVEALVLDVDDRITGTEERRFEEEDGSTTVVLRGWGRSLKQRNSRRNFNEMVLHPVPDRVIYDSGDGQALIWGEPSSGGVELLPRLSLAYYALMALALAALLGLVWFVLRRRDHSRILRQLFFAPASYVVAHLLIKGTRARSFSLEHDLFSILLIAAALYALASLAWQVWLRRRKETEA